MLSDTWYGHILIPFLLVGIVFLIVFLMILNGWNAELNQFCVEQDHEKLTGKKIVNMFFNLYHVECGEGNIYRNIRCERFENTCLKKNKWGDCKKFEYMGYCKVCNYC